MRTCLGSDTKRNQSSVAGLKLISVAELLQTAARRVRWNLKRGFLIAAVLAGGPVTGHCCEPIVPLFHLLSGASLAGPAMLTGSLWWLAAAVAIKCAAFVFFEKRLNRPRAAGFMLVANAVSTIPGVLLAAFTSSIGGFFFALPMVAGLGWLVQWRLRDLPSVGRWPWVSSGGALVGFVAFFILSVGLFAAAQGAIDGGSHGGYWLYKFLFVTLVATTGIVISMVLEESVIAWLARNSAGRISLISSVMRANYVTLGVVLLVVAVQILPRRLQSPGFLALWLHLLGEKLG